ncbi:class I SAM-dependent methyltransferase [Natronoglycomyces albus]|uniref:Class I SAM-dependent methyltransferase n=1 Tax=Natronoglycomyces albus TaxID=2811108 RepID=A0A895XU98_9ACTN|nr:class I SAM-dependent methyltransferase [Natronoglycomyces albus]QSB06869.1 class I SAM-dependent methyltransferase [Natronoglycomyces albus]
MGVDVAESIQATAYLAAACRAVETSARKPRLSDPYAERIIASHPDGARIRKGLLGAGTDEVVHRTILLDRLLARAALTAGTTVVNLGAGFCTRPYRLDLSECAEVIEADAPALIKAKETLLADADPSCPVRRVPLDVRDVNQLAALLNPIEGPLVVVTEGLLVYLPRTDLAAIAATINASAAQRWLTDIVGLSSAAAMEQLAQKSGAGLNLYGLGDLRPFEDNGWTVTDYRPLPVPARPGSRTKTGASSTDVVDGVLELTAYKTE